MREDRGTAEWPAAFGIEVDGAVLARVKADIAEELALAPCRILFLGDTKRADIDGP